MPGEELEIVGGPLTGRRIPIGDELILGREAAGPGLLQGDTQASRRHARIYRAQGALAIADLGSTNGTYVNNQRITEARWLQTGDQIRVGMTVARFVAAAQAQAAPPQPQPQAPVQPQPPTEQQPPAQQPAYQQPAPQQPAPQQPAPQQPAAQHAPPASNLTLTVASGPLAGHTFPIIGELQFGRAVGGMGALGGDIQLSRRHARILQDAQGHAIVEDLQSSNGTFLNGNRLVQPQYLSPGDRVRLGSTELVVQGAGLAAMTSGSFGYAPPKPKAHSRRIITAFAATLLVALVGGGALVAALAPSGPRKCETKTNCQGPPSRANALVTLTHYTVPVGFRVAYDGESWSVKEKTNDSITLEAPTRDAIVVLRGVPGSQDEARSAMQQRIDDLAQNVVSLTSDPRPQDRLFAPTVGFRKGVGRSLIASSDTSGTTAVVVMAAGDGKLNVVATVVTGAQSDDDRQVAFQGASSVLNTVRWGQEEQ